MERLPQRPAVGPRKTVMLSAGHGTGSNIGNVGVHGQLEQDTTLALATELAERLRSLDRFDVVLAREGAERPSYAQRVEEAERLGVDVLVELHTDSRGPYEVWARTPERVVYRNDHDPGFSVLFRDKGPLAEAHASLARTIAHSLMETGFPAYDGASYGRRYARDATPGAFRDRRSLYMLRTPRMPAVLVELHHALDYEESLRWREPRVREAFAWSMADALTRYLYPSPWESGGQPQEGRL